MRAATAYFAGVGTVAVAIAAGLGGGLLLGDIMSPQPPKHPSSEVTRLEQRASPQPIQAMNGASQPVPYLPPAQVAATVAEPQPAQPQPTSTQSAEPKQSSEPDATARSAAAQPVAAVEPPALRERAAEESFAKARDADVKREARRTEDRRKAERRQQWAEKRKSRQRGDDDLGEVEASVRQATEARPLFGREPGFGAGRMTLFDD